MRTCKCPSRFDRQVFPEVGEVSGFEYDFGGQMDFADYFKEIKASCAVRKIGIVGRLTFPAIIYNKLVCVFEGAGDRRFDDVLYEIPHHQERK